MIQDKYNRILETRKDELAEGVAKLRQMYEIDDLSEPVLDKVYAFVLLYEKIFEEYNVAAVSAECWTAMAAEGGCYALRCLSLARGHGLYHRLRERHARRP